MSDDGRNPGVGRFGTPPGEQVMPSDADVRAMIQASKEVMAVQDVTTGDAQMPLRIRGSLTMASDEAFNRLRPQFEAVGHTPTLRREDGMDIIRALPVVFGKEHAGPPRITIIMLILTIISVFFVGLFHSDTLFIGPLKVVAVQMTGDVQGVARIFGDPILAEHPELLPSPEAWKTTLQTALLYVLALLGILGTHEMGHYLMARRHKVHTTLPFFIPLPLPPLGTLGAVIAMKEPAPNRQVQFDIGIAGPLAGLIVAIPVLIWGLTLSEVHTRQEILAGFPEVLRDQTMFSQEGNSLAYLALKYLVFGEILPSGDRDVFIHAVAFAGWAGLLVTALNLLPIGQLDGGHVLYGLLGDKVQKLRWPVIGLLVVLASAGTLAEMEIVNLGFGWSGWWLWVFLVFFLLRSHAPVLDEITGLDSKRKLLGIVMLIIFVLLFTPMPLTLSIPAALVTGWPVI
ncbi:MAG: site-2 protease family protein [Anaerolineae bacterium]|nr:site-2 protease family protein [Anaerolineae bacterium]